jgi:antitoxin component YwqK of YwqJK toxin-antitoxin module
MKTKEHYQNGQKVYEQNGDTLTYCFKTGIIKATGISINGIMEGRWIFNRESGKLWQIGHFKNNRKHGEWIRYDKNGKEEYHAQFEDGKLVSKK